MREVYLITLFQGTIYDRGWAGKIQLTIKQNVLPPAFLHHKKMQ
jgi:hypothetical protein